MTLFPLPEHDHQRRTVASGAIHLPGWLDTAAQRRLVHAFHSWATGPVPIRAASLPRGHQMTVKTVYLGWHWQPYRYTRTAGDVNGRPVLPLPAWLIELAYHGVPKIFPATADPATGLARGRINITMRDTGLC